MVRRFAWVMLVITISIATSWYVARQVTDDATESTGINPVPPPSVLEREVVATSPQLIAPVISANAIIKPNEGGDGWMLEAPAPNDALAYQLLDTPLGVKALINGGPSGFDCEWIGLGYNGGSISQPGTGVDKTSASLPTNATNVTMQCAIPDDIRASAGMNGMVVIQTQPPTEAQALPLTAVNGTADSGTVVVVHEDGTTELRTVELGISDTYHIEIIAGLTEDESVLLYPVQQDFADASTP